MLKISGLEASYGEKVGVTGEDVGPEGGQGIDNGQGEDIEEILAQVEWGREDGQAA